MQLFIVSNESNWNILNEMNPAKKMQFEAVVANPPFSYRWQPKEEMAKDPKGKGTPQSIFARTWIRANSII